MTIKIKHKRGTASAVASANPTPAAGELVFETDTRRFKLGDGSTAYSSLSYVTPYVTATDRLLGRSSAGAGSAEEITCTSFGRSLIDDADAAAARTTLSVQPTASPAFTGTASFGASVSVGTSTPTFVNANYSGVHIHAATATSLRLTNATTGQTATDGFELLQDSGGGAYVWNRESTDLLFGTAATTRLTISSTGVATFAGQILADDLATSNSVVYAFDGDTNTGVGRAGADILTVVTGGTERVRVDASGNVGIGVTPTQRLHVVRSGTGIAARFTDNSTQTLDIGVTASAGVYYDNPNSGYHEWQIGGSGKMRLTGGGELLIGSTTDQGGFNLQATGSAWIDNLYLSTITNWGRLAINHNGATTFAAGWNNTDTGSAGQTTLNILRNGTSVGSITTTNAATAFNTSSDYRLKDDVQAMDGATARLASLRPVTWQWRVGGVGEGFLAHELADAVPLAVTGEKDAVGGDGKPIWQSVDLSKLVPLLVAALQESNARIAALEERLNHG